MDSGQWIAMLLGSGVTGTVVTAFFTRMSTKETIQKDNNVQLWDRTYKLIESLEKQIEKQQNLIDDLKEQVAGKKKENMKLLRTIEEMEQVLLELKRQLAKAKGER